jgi:tetratricopeptide (TPR) repeat protein
MDPEPRVAVAGGIVGRERALTTLAALLESARAGRGRSALVSGEAGIGKTTVVQALAERARADGMATVWCWCTAENPLPYFPWRPLLRHLNLPEAGAAAAPVGHQDLDRHRMFSSILDGLEASGRARPVLIVLEDAHWADEPSLTLLRVIVGALAGLPACLVVTARDDPHEMPAAVAGALRDLPSGVLRLPLDPLSANDVGLVVSEVTGRPPDDSLAVQVRERTGGNPFLVIEVARGLTGEAAQVLPRGARELISRQLQRLPAASNQALTAAAFVGDPIDLSLVAAVVDTTEAELVRRLDAAVQARLLTTDPDGGLRFVHALVSDVVTATAAASERARLHERIATVLEARGDANPGTLARHWSLAVGPTSRERAAHWSVVQARESRRQLGFEQAVAAYRRGLESTGEDRIALALELADTERLAGDAAAARATLLDVVRRARAAGRAEDVARAALGLGGGMAGFEVALRDDEQVQLLRESLSLLPPGDGALRAAVAARLSVALTELAPDAERIALAEDAVAMAHRVGDAAVRVAALAAYCDAISGPGHVAARLDAAVEMRAIADAAGDHIGRLLARRLIVVALAERGELAAADAEGAAYARIADRLGVPQYRWLPLVWLGRQACLRGDLAAARRAADAAAELGERAGSVNARYMATSVRGQIYRVEGTVGEHRGELLDAYADILDVPSSFGAQAACAIEAGDLDEARRLVHAALAVGLDAMPKDSEWLAGVCFVGLSAIRLGDEVAARAAYDALAPYAGIFVVEGLAATVVGATDLMLGRLAAFLGDPRAREHLEAALAAHRRTGSPVLAADAAAELDRLEPSGRPRASTAPVEDGVFRRAGRLWQITYGPQSVVVPDSKGMGDLALLLAAPGRDVHVLDLVDATGMARATAAPADDVIDPAARAAYRGRLRELEQEVAEAEAAADLGRAERLRAERDFIAAELGAALGLGGRVRTAADPVERARKAVGMRIGTALRAIDAVHRPLARHLRLAVRTGRFCSYRPEHPVRWHT